LKIIITDNIRKYPDDPSKWKFRSESGVNSSTETAYSSKKELIKAIYDCLKFTQKEYIRKPKVHLTMANCICKKCKKLYIEHPFVQGREKEKVRRLCSGKLIECEEVNPFDANARIIVEESGLIE